MVSSLYFGSRETDGAEPLDRDVKPPPEGQRAETATDPTLSFSRMPALFKRGVRLHPIKGKGWALGNN